MKNISLWCLAGILALGSVHAISLSQEDALSPVTRVVELLKGLSKQVEEEGKKEEDLYETYVCWAKSIISQKTASNSEASSKIDSLETYLADLASGRVELTSERADLEKEIEELMGDLETSKALRKKENEDFEVAKDEMSKAIKALDDAVEVLGEATKDHKKGVLMAMRARLNGGMAALAEQQASLERAVDLGKRFLPKADASFLQRVLFGEVPDVDWKKLKRKATFKMSYKARSFKIQDVLKKMHTTFENNLKDATEKESESLKTYNTLKDAKSDQLDEAQKALTKMESENGARGMTKSDTEDEVKSLKEQVKNDKKFISDTEDALAAKKKEWKERSEMRAGELEAISKAVSILYNDDSRDLFKRSFASQVSFLQSTQKMPSFGRQISLLQSASETNSQVAMRIQGASRALRDAARQSGDARLIELAEKIAADPNSVKSNFGPVLAAIDKMIALLKEDEKKDLETKEECEKTRMSDTRKAVQSGRAIDDMTDTITKLESDIKQLTADIEQLLKDKKQVAADLDAATKQRKEENAAFLKTDADDKLAAETVMSAKEALSKFYKDKNLMLVQSVKAQQPFGGPAGEAPPPPPPTWGSSYGGKTGETTGILSIMEMVHQDIQKDRQTAKDEEAASLKEYQSFKKDCEDQMKELQKDADAKSGIKGQKMEDKTDEIKERTIASGSLKALTDKMQGIAPNCEYYTVNFSMRSKNRQVEMDGLHKAQAILKGGSFDSPDPSREIKPGDAFMQRRKA